MTPRLLRLLAIPVLAGAAPALAGAELVVRDLALSLGVLPAGFSYTLSTPTLERSGEDAFDSGTELAFGGRYALSRPGDALGLVLGADLTTSTWTYGSSGHLFATGLRATAGLGWAIADDWNLLAEPGIRYGLSALELPSSASSAAFSGSGTCTAYDLRLATQYQIRPGLLAQFHAGWIAMSHELSDDAIDVTLDMSGLIVGIGIVWRWSTAPPRIE